LDRAVNKGAVLVIIALSSFLPPFAISSINIALPSIAKEFAMDAISQGWVSITYLLTSAMLLIPLGRFADIHGRKKMFIFGTAVFTVSSFLLAISTSTALFISFRVLQGIGSAMLFGTGVAILTSVFHSGEKGKALGINTAAVYLGLSLGPVIGGFLTEQFGWRSIFLLNVPSGLTMICLMHWRLKGEWADSKGEKFDLIGSMIYCFMLVAIMYGFSSLSTSKFGLGSETLQEILFNMTGPWLIPVGVVAILAFVKWETKVTSPILNIHIFRNNTVFAFSNLAALINYSATNAVTFLLSLYLQYIKGFSPQSAGLVLLSQPVMQAIFSPLAGRLSDKIEARIISSAGMTCTAIGLSCLAFLNSVTPLEFIVTSLILLGFGFALFSSPNTNAVMSSVEKRFYGVASGTIATMRHIGQMMSMIIATTMFAIYIGETQITPEYYPLFLISAQTAFKIFAALCFTGIFASLARGNASLNKQNLGNAA